MNNLPTEVVSHLRYKLEWLPGDYPKDLLAFLARAWADMVETGASNYTDCPFGPGTECLRFIDPHLPEGKQTVAALVYCTINDPERQGYWITMVYTDPVHRDLGLFTQLMGAVKALARASGVKRIGFMVSGENQKMLHILTMWKMKAYGVEFAIHDP